MDVFGDESGPGGTIELTALHDATKQRYLNYALSVITSRALPDVRDGLKPVQRRILYGMYKDLRLRADSRFLKSARVVGEVMGKYHPHGDQSIYDAMVRMSQSFSLRYPLVDGQGNFGSIDGDAAAAMRYTEARLRALAEEFLSEIGEQTVAFRPTYDGQLFEPIVLPAQAPNLLINGSSGIAVGMATNVPPHNLGEVIDALVAMVDDPLVDLPSICRHIKGPDFPTGGELISSEADIQAVYETGQGPIRVRGTYELETINRKKCIVLTSVPYGLNKSNLVEKIAQIIVEKKVPQLVDIRDESTEDIRVILELRRGAEPKAAMAYLYRHTPLEQNFSVNLTCLVPTENPEVSAPARIGLLKVLRHFLDFRMEVVTRRLEYALGKLRKAIHRLEGFETIFDALDELIALIRASEGKADAARKIMERFKLDEEQTDAILELKLYRLAKLEILLIQQELLEKRMEAERLSDLLSSEFARWQLIRTELLELKEAYADPRRSLLSGPSELALSDFNPEAFIIREKTWVFVSRQGRIKRQKGFSDVSAIRVPDGDSISWVLRTDTTQTLIIFTQFGKAYTVRVDDITATTGYGDPIQSIFNFADGERIVGVASSDARLHPETLLIQPQTDLSLNEAEAPVENESQLSGALLVAMSSAGRVTRVTLSSFHDVSTKNGRRYMSVGGQDHVVAAFASDGTENVALATRMGRGMLFAVGEIPPKSGAVKGVNAIRLESKDSVIGFCLTKKKRDGLVVRTSRGRELIVRETSYRLVKRGGKGTPILKVGRFEPCDLPVLIMTPDVESDVDETPDESIGEES